MTITNTTTNKKIEKLLKNMVAFFNDSTGLTAPIDLLIVRDENYNARGEAFYVNGSYRVIINLYNNSEECGVVMTLFHELTHVKQMVEKRLKIDGNDVIYNRKRYKNPIENVVFVSEYKNLPWEKEANILSDKLIRVVFDM